MSDFPCCELSDTELGRLLDAQAQEAAAARVARWIAPTLLDRFPNGPYAVHAYWPATRRETTSRNHTAESAVAIAEGWAALTSDVHVSLDTCG